MAASPNRDMTKMQSKSTERTKNSNRELRKHVNVSIKVKLFRKMLQNILVLISKRRKKNKEEINQN